MNAPNLVVIISGPAGVGKTSLCEELLHGSDQFVRVYAMQSSIQLLEERLKKRGRDDATTIQRRLAVVREELKRWSQYDYVIVTGKLQHDYERMKAIVEAEKMRAARLSFEV